MATKIKDEGMLAAASCTAAQTFHIPPLGSPQIQRWDGEVKADAGHHSAFISGISDSYKVFMSFAVALGRQEALNYWVESLGTDLIPV